MDQEKILEQMSHAPLQYTLHVDGKVFDLQDVLLSKSQIPVRKPTTRGGVYFTDTTANKIKAKTDDLSIIGLLPKLMLGPNTEFGMIQVKTRLELDGTQKDVTLTTHVSNTMNTKNIVELNLIVDNVSFD